MNRLGSGGQGEGDAMVNGGGACEGDEDINSFDYNRFGISESAGCSRCRRKCALKTAIALLCGLCALLSIILTVISYTVFQRIDSMEVVMSTEDLTFRDRLDTFQTTLEKLDKLVRAKEEFISNTVLSWRLDVDRVKESTRELSNRLDETFQSVQRLDQMGHRVQALEDATGVSGASKPRFDLEGLRRWSSEANATLLSLRSLPRRLDGLAANVSAAAAESADELDELSGRLDELAANASSAAEASRAAEAAAAGQRRELSGRARAAQAAAEAAASAARAWRPAVAALNGTLARAEDAWEKGRAALAQQAKAAGREAARLDGAYRALRDDWSRAQRRVEERVGEQYENVTSAVDRLMNERGNVRNATVIHGLPGPPGPKGDRGEPGMVGISGPSGAKGDTGEAGLVGPKGETGEIGPQGPIGIPGSRGVKGSKGSRGPTGPTGPNGPPATKGEQGPRGPRGFPGEQGPGGMPGMQGPPGEPYDPRSEACKGSGMYFNGSCYFVSPTKVNWTVANESCTERHSHLVIISTEAEQMWLVSKTMGHFVYIGLHDTMVEDNWEWVDGTKLSGPTFWAEGQPDNWALALNGREDCGGFTFAGRWNDFPCSMELSYVCEKDVESVTP